MSKKPVDHSDPFHVHVLTTKEMLSQIISKIKKKKVSEKQSAFSNTPPPQPQGIAINHIAVVLDGRVEEVIRAENRLAALFLSNPTFVEFDPNKERPTIGWTYDGESFGNPE